MYKILSAILSFFTMLYISTAWAAPGDITTIAGGSVGDGGPAPDAVLYYINSAATDSVGNYYIADRDNHRIRKVNAVSGIITTVAGNGVGGYSGDNGPALSAKLNSPLGVFIDRSGNIFIADTWNNRIRKVDTAGVITTVAGNSGMGYGGDNLPATSTTLFNPSGVAIDNVGSLYIADQGNHRIRKVDTSGIIMTVAGNGTGGYTGDNVSAISSGLFYPSSVAIDSTGIIYIADTYNHRIRKVDSSGIITTIAGTGTAGYSVDNGYASAAMLNYPYGIAVDTADNLYIADTWNQRIRVITSSVIITTIGGNGMIGYSGDNGYATSASMRFPKGLAVDPWGIIYIADSENGRVRRIGSSPRIITSVAGNGTPGFGGDNGAAIFASLNGPSGVAVDKANNLYIADNSNNRIRKVDANGTITTFAGTGQQGSTADTGDNVIATMARLTFPSGVMVDMADHMYVAALNEIRKVDAQTGIIHTIAGTAYAGFTGDNGPATAARINHPAGIAADGSGNIYIADKSNQRIRKIDAYGIITTIAGNGIAGYSGDNGPATSASFNYPDGIAVDKTGNIFVSDTYNHRIRKINLSGIVSTVAGNGSFMIGDNGPAISAGLAYPRGIAVDGDNNIYIADSEHRRIRKVAAATGTITTVAGNGTNDFSGDHGPATMAGLSSPVAVAVDAFKNLYIAELGSQRIRKVQGITQPTMTLDAPSMTYGGNGNITVTVHAVDATPTGEVTLSLDGGAAVSLTLSPINGSNPPAASAVFTITRPSAGNHTLNASFAAQGNFAACSAGGVLMVNPMTLSVTATVTGKIYDGTTSATVTYADNRLSGDVFTINGAAAFSDKNVGLAKTVNISMYLSGPDAGNYILASNSATATANITPVSVTPTVTVANKVYDRTTTATITTRSVSTIFAGDIVTLSGGTAAFTDANVGAGKTVVVTGLVLSGASAGNYYLGSSTAYTTAPITPRSIVPAVTVSSKPYDGTTIATIASRMLYTPYPGDDVTLAGGVATFITPTAGTNKPVTVSGFVLSGTASANYLLYWTTITATASITSIPLTPSVIVSDKVYDGTTAAAIVTRNLSSVAAGDSVTLIGGIATFITSSIGTNKTVNVVGLVLAGASSGNYSLATSTISAAASITPAVLVPSVTVNNKYYDSATSAMIASRSVSTVMGGDMVTLTGGIATFDNPNVGTSKAVMVTGLTLSGPSAGNYILATSAMVISANIMPSGLTPQVAISDKIYDGTIAGTIASRMVYTVFPGDDVTLTGGAVTFLTPTAGTNKSVTVTGLMLSGASAGNYALISNTASAKANITPAPLTPSVTASDKVYDRTTAATIATKSVSTVITGDDVTLAGGTAMFADANAGTNKPVNVTGLALAGNSASNYYLISNIAAGAASITLAPLTPIVKVRSKEYDGTTAATIENLTLSGIIPGDSVGLYGGSAAFADANVGLDKLVSVTGLSLYGMSAPNYEIDLSYVTAHANIVAVDNRIIETVAGGGIGDGELATNVGLRGQGTAIDSAGNIYIADTGNHRIRRVDAITKIITTVAGNGSYGYSGDGGNAADARLYSPSAVAVDSAGNIYVADLYNNRVRKVDAATKIITTVAGNGSYGYRGDGGDARNASLYYPYGVSVDSAGNIYISDFYNNRIRKVDAATKIITTVAGNGSSGFSGDGGDAKNASLSYPYGVSVDSAGNIYISDLYNNRIRKVDAVTKIITTVAGNGSYGFSGDGGDARNASLYYPYGVSVDSAGNIYISDFYNSRIRKVDAATKIITTVAGNGSYGFSGDGGDSRNAGLYYPYGVSVDSAGNIYIADYGNNRVRKVDAATKIITTVAGNGSYGYRGDGGDARNASLYYPYGVSVDSAGNIYISDFYNNRIRKVDAATKIITTVAGNGSPGYSGDGGDAKNGSLSYPYGVSVDSAGNIYISDFYNSRIRMVDAATKIITTVAGNGSYGYSGDGGDAKDASLYYPYGVSVDSAGNIYIADLYNHRIRKVDAATKIITTVAGNGSPGYSGDGGDAKNGSLSYPYGVSVDSAGNIYISDFYNSRIRKVDAATKIITTVAGNGSSGYSGDYGYAKDASLYSYGVSVDSAGNIYIADYVHNRIRKVDASTKIITTVAGNGIPGYSGDGGDAKNASLYYPQGVSIDSAGNVYIADTNNKRIRKVLPVSAVTTVQSADTPVVLGPLASMTFDSIISGGVVTAKALTSGDMTSPSNFKILDGSVYEITTNAVVSGNITVCLSYNPAQLGGVSETQLKLLHYANGAWQDITTLVDTTAKKVCGETTSLSPFAIAASAAYSIMATADSQGSISPAGPVMVSAGGNAVFTITPNTGYSVRSVVVDGVDQGAITAYTFSNISADHIITATFSPIVYVISATAGVHGGISPAGAVTVNNGSGVTFAMVPDAGYRIQSVSVDGIDQGAVTDYTFSNVTADHTISASFTPITFTVSASAGANGSITPAGDRTVNYGSSITFTVSPDAGYRVDSVLVDGVDHGAITSYAFLNVTDNHAISAVFVPITYTITVGAGPNGAITPSGPVILHQGGGATFTIAPNPGFIIRSVLVNNADQGPITSYTFTNIQADQTINATFTAITHDITATAGAGGAITPTGVSSVTNGGSQSYTITPSSGNTIADVLVDGVSIGSTSSYTFTNVTTNHAISASFRMITYEISASAGAGGSVSPAGSTIKGIGSNQEYTIAPDPGYFISDVLVDGASVGARASYTFTNLQANHSINAVFMFADTTPDPFVFVDQADVKPGALASSNTVTVLGINVPTIISISGGEYSINGGTFTSAAGTVMNGDSVSVRLTSSTYYSTRTEAMLSIGTASANFSVTTKANTAPTAAAGNNRSVHAGALVVLDGSGSTDPDGDPLTYAWSFVSKPSSSSTAQLSDSASITPAFVADQPGDYVLSLTVFDSIGATSDPAFITISTTNTAPIADAGPDQSVVLIGTLVELDGTQSYDLDGDPIAYAWSFSSVPAGSTAALASMNTATTSFIPDVHGDYIVQLLVSDAWSRSVAALAKVSFANVIPVANAGQSLSADVGENVLLNGTGSSDANGDPLSYSWSFASKPQGSLAEISSSLTANASFVPDSTGTYVIQLIVNDGAENSIPSTIQVQTVDQRTAAMNAVKDVQQAIQALNPKKAFKNVNLQKTMVNKLNSVIKDLRGHDCRDALEQLQHDILRKLDGCARTGEPHRKDWIRTCEAQATVYPLVVEAIVQTEAWCPLEEIPSHEQDHDDEDDD